MTRVFVDMRMCYSYHMIASMAGACDLDVVILSARECYSDKVIKAIKQDLKRNSSISKASVLDIPCRTVDAIEVVREAAHSNDIIVTDSSPLAFEFLRKVGVAVNNWGEEYTDLNIFDKLDDFYRCKSLLQQGINPYKPRKFRKADRRKLQQKLEELIYVVCGKVPREEVVSQASAKTPANPCTFVGMSPSWELQTGARVYVDGDACPVLPEIIELCGSAGVPVVYVSNMHQKNLIAKACKANPGLPSRMRRVPEVAQVTVPVRKDAADKAIRKRIRPHDIALTNDVGLLANCLNKNAVAIDYLGRVYVRSEGGVVGKAAVRRMREKQGPVNSECDRMAFRESLQRALEKRPADDCQVEVVDRCQVVALEIVRHQGRVTTRKLCERAGAGSRVCLRALRELASMGVLEWHGSSAHDPTQFYSLAC